MSNHHILMSVFPCLTFTTATITIIIANNLLITALNTCMYKLIHKKLVMFHRGGNRLRDLK